MKKDKWFKPHEQYQLVFEDYFTDCKKTEKLWWYREGERLGGLNKKANVILNNGLTVRMDTRTVGNKVKYCGGGLISRDLFGYGYYEAEGILFGDTGGLHSSFWSMGLSDGDGIIMPKENVILEIDGYEVDSGRPNLIGTNIHYYIGGQKTVGGVIGSFDYERFDTSKRTFTLGYEWLPNQINWYLDGMLIRSIKNPKFYGPQNVWITALASEYFDQNIDHAVLPGESVWKYFRYYNLPLNGVNLVVNPGFEYIGNKDKTIPVGWYVSGSHEKASKVFKTEEAFDGDYVLRHYHNEGYEVMTWVKVPYIQIGKYSFEARVRTNDNEGHFIIIKDGNDEICSLAIPFSENGNWCSVLIEELPIEKGECTIAISSKAVAGSELWVDGISLKQVDGEVAYTDLNLFEEEMEKPFLNLGELRIGPNTSGSGYVESNGNWQNSGLEDLFGGSRFCAVSEKPMVNYLPELKNQGQYDVWFYNICYENRAESIEVEVHHQNGIFRKTLSQKEISKNIYLGSYELDNLSKVVLRSLSDNDGDLLAAGSVVLEDANTKSVRSLLEEGLLMKTDSNKVLSGGVASRVSAEDYRIKVLRQNGCIMVPLHAISVLLGAGTIETGENDVITVFYQDYMIRFQPGSDKFSYKKTENVMTVICREINDVVYVPAVALAEAFGRYISIVGDHCLITTEIVDEAIDLICIQQVEQV